MSTAADVARITRSTHSNTAASWETSRLAALQAATWVDFTKEHVFHVAYDSLSIGRLKKDTSIYVVAAGSKVTVTPPMFLFV